jgi:hypothetical protein
MVKIRLRGFKDGGLRQAHVMLHLLSGSRLNEGGEILSRP